MARLRWPLSAMARRSGAPARTMLRPAAPHRREQCSRRGNAGVVPAARRSPCSTREEHTMSFGTLLRSSAVTAAGLTILVLACLPRGTAPTTRRGVDRPRDLQIPFVANEGQAPADVAFYAPG